MVVSFLQVSTGGAVLSQRRDSLPLMSEKQVVLIGKLEAIPKFPARLTGRCLIFRGPRSLHTVLFAHHFFQFFSAYIVPETEAVLT